MIKNSENIGERTNKSQFFRGRYNKLTSNIIILYYIYIYIILIYNIIKGKKQNDFS